MLAIASNQTCIEYKAGRVCKKRDRKDSIYNMSLYEVARSVIQEWNREDDRKAIIDHEQSNNNTDVK